VQSAALDMSDYFQSLIDTGKAELMAGRTTEAIVAFRQASYDPAHAAEAYNGMGVAYAMLGRNDLATRFFTSAVAANPADGRFSRNLARTETTRREALADAAEAPSQPMSQSSAEPTLLATQDATPARIQPVDDARPVEVLISSRAQTDSPRSPVMALSGPRVQAAGLRPSAGATPIRIAANDGGHRSPPAYPVRIDLTKTR
jgi:tetratricopeptide (TPR) repeat protein